MKTRIFWTFDLCKNEALKYKLKKILDKIVQMPMLLLLNISG